MRNAERYAVVDVETTSGDPRIAGIMEVAIILTDGRSALERWSSLVHPQGPIDFFVGRLTGITPAMVRDAPRFGEVAAVIERMTEGTTIVAHNTRFDMTALATAFARQGRSFRRDSLCTEQLSRQFFPHLKLHNLNSLCLHMGVNRRGNHRAMVDAMACAEAFAMLLATFGEARMMAACLPQQLRLSA